MRLLIVNNHCISDPTVGFVQCLLTMARWLVAAGHQCQVLTTARLESSGTLTIQQHLQSLGISTPTRIKTSGCPVVQYEFDGVPIQLLMTEHNKQAEPHRGEAEQYIKLFSSLLDAYRPHVVLAANSHRMVQWALEHAQRRRITTAFRVATYGHEDPQFFQHVDHILTPCQFISDHLLEKIGLDSVAIDPPIDWSKVVAPTESRAFVTFVNPSPAKGVVLFARLADMLGSRRDDIPIMIVQSVHTAASLNSIRGIDFAKYPQILAAPPAQQPSDIFALTRILLVPSVWHEASARVAAEAMINGIPPVVSNRGGLSQTVGGDFSQGGGGRVLSIPDWLTWYVSKLPSEAEVEPWFEAVCQLWDDASFYEAVSTRAFEIASQRYGEEASREKYVAYLTSLNPGAS